MKINNPVIILLGPTAIGKTKIALKIGKLYNAEIINADSIQVYRDLNIGSAKPSLDEQKTVPHHLLNIVSPTEDFNVANFIKLAEKKISKIKLQNKRILIVGGTGFYIKALLLGLTTIPQIKQRIKSHLKVDFKRLGSKNIYHRLIKIDSEIMKKLHPNDNQRMLRALEVFLQTGIPLSLIQKKHKTITSQFSYSLIGLTLTKPELNYLITKRCLSMWKEGLLEETRELLLKKISIQHKPLQSIGYMQAILYLKGKLNKKDAIDEMISKTQKYAKKQLTLFKKIKNVHWFSPKNLHSIMIKVQQYWGNN